MTKSNKPSKSNKPVNQPSIIDQLLMGTDPEAYGKAKQSARIKLALSLAQEADPVHSQGLDNQALNKAARSARIKRARLNETIKDKLDAKLRERNMIKDMPLADQLALEGPAAERAAEKAKDAAKAEEAKAAAQLALDEAKLAALDAAPGSPITVEAAAPLS